MWFPPENSNNELKQTAVQSQTVKRNSPLSQDQINQFKAALHNGTVTFTYYKTLKDAKNKTIKDENGNVVFDIENPRNAHGTMQTELLPVPKKLQEMPTQKLEVGIANAEKKQLKKKNHPANSIVYFDLDANGFRCLYADGLIQFKAD